MSTTKAVSVVGVALLLGISSTAFAQQRRAVIEPEMYEYEYEEQYRGGTPFGLGLSVGGGVVGNTASRARNFTDVGGSWDARLTFGTRSILAAEAAYIGTAQNIDAIGLDNDAILVSNGAEAAARLNIVSGPVTPYVLAGVGWRHYSLTNEDFNTSNVQDSDDVVHFPLGAGIGFQIDQLLLDLRGTFRPTIDDDLLGGDTSLHTLTGELRAGFEF